MIESKKTDLAYYAGIVDADGTICISRVKKKKGDCRAGGGYKRGCTFILVVAVGSTDIWLLNSIKMAFGGNVRIDRHQLGRFHTNREFFVWSATGRSALPFLESIVNYLHLKKAQAEIAIAFQRKKTRGTKDDKAWAIEEAQRAMVSSMNKKGRRTQ